MKKFLLILICLIAFSCSKDDDSSGNCIVCDTIAVTTSDGSDEITTEVSFSSLYPNGLCVGQSLVSGFESAFSGAFGGSDSDSDSDSDDDVILTAQTIGFYLDFFKQDYPSGNCRLQ